MKKVIADIEIGDIKITSASEMAEAFNCHFANIGHDLARDIPSADTDTVPESYLISTISNFGLGFWVGIVAASLSFYGYFNCP